MTPAGVLPHGPGAMYAILYRLDGELRLTVGRLGPDDVDGHVVAWEEVEGSPDEAYESVTGHVAGDAPAPTIEEVTDAFDPWLAWYGGSDRGCHAVLYGRKGNHDRRVDFRESDEGYEVTLQFGRVADVPGHVFEAADVEPVVVTSASGHHAKHVFFDLCAVR